MINSRADKFVIPIHSIMKNYFFLIILILGKSSSLFSQKIYGTVYNEKGELLPFSSIIIKGTSKGVTANNKAVYDFNLYKGKFTIVCQHIGYQALEKEIVCDADVQVNFVLKEQQLMMKEVVISSNGENPAYAIIRQAIKKRNYYNNQVKSFICDYYSKDVIKLRSLPKKFLNQNKKNNEVKSNLMLDSSGKGILYLAESKSTLYSQQPDKEKLEVNSSRVSGSNSFGFAFSNLINFYTNNVTVFKGGNNRGFISPIADGALRYYKYKILGTFEENGKVINTIKVMPKRSYEPLFSGIINIVDEDWNIHSLDFQLTKESQLELLDTLKITQQYIPVNGDVWRIKNQLYYFGLNLFNIDVVGDFLSVYSDYKINPLLDKKIFDKVIVKYDSSAALKAKSYWDTIRPVPLNLEEVKDYQVKDSIFQSKQANAANDNNTDTLRKRQGKLKVYGFLFPGFDRVHYGHKHLYKWGADPLLLNLQYNTAEGIVSKFTGYFEKYFTQSKSKLTVEPDIRYGFGNSHFNPSLNVNLFTNVKEGFSSYRNNYWSLSVGKRVSQYNQESVISPLLNEISTLFYGKNILKTYENSFLQFGFNKKFDNGWNMSFSALYEDRLPLFNVENYTFKKKDTVFLTENYPVEKVNVNEIKPHQALILKASVSIKPGQQFIQYPHSKVPIGSKYPTFSIGYEKGIKDLLGSDVDFDKWSFDVFDDKNFRLAGVLKYRISIGGFLNNKKVNIQDFKHFNSTSLKSTLNYMKGFQLMSAYGNSNTAKFCSEVHIEHHFNGLITNKIPVFKKNNWKLVGGINAYYIRDNNHHEEVFAGIENINKIFRIDYVTAYQNGKYVQSAFVLGVGGLFSDNQNASDKRESSKSARRALTLAF